MKLKRDFYLRSALLVAQDLIGACLVHETPEGLTKGIIVETEAYMGSRDAAAHSYGSRLTGRTAIQYGPGGFAYIYSIYGLHLCMNVVANNENHPEGVLLRALQPIHGLDLMSRRRGTDNRKNLCSGPGKLCQAMGIQKADYGADLCGDTFYIEPQNGLTPVVSATKRINIAYSGEAADYPWRFLLDGSEYISVPPRRGRIISPMDGPDTGSSINP